ncbi:MBL fold metallo-hydrolase [Fulvivirgaceae bacterium BMA12]|uniref:MBL fold metallo-hydrolase n=1 Tax=Agaribacillus aureus TaxID=3051825 RepID=A0ABT8L8M0_9BACT|nr:MBL fold metallo-hydrolase [Fulvivirgaceae bacterium BMA12]
MKNFALILVLLTAFCYRLQAQKASPDQFQTHNGPLTVQPILHGSLVLTWNEQTIYIDPYGGKSAFDGMATPDLILITDIHGDHLNTGTLETIDVSNTTIICPQAVADKIPGKYKSKLKVLGNGESLEWSNVKIAALPMYNLPETPDSRHPKGRGNGYLIELGGKTVYISGDTEDIPEMRALKNIDIAFVCMNLPYTMNIDQAASAVLEFVPKVVYPFHYRGKEGLSDVEGFKRLVAKGNKNIDVRLRNWYPGN